MPDTSLWFQIEQEIADFLVSHLEDASLSPERAIEIAKYVVRVIPHRLSDTEMKALVPKLDSQFTELAGIVHKYLLPQYTAYQQAELAKTSAKIQDYIRSKKPL